MKLMGSLFFVALMLMISYSYTAVNAAETSPLAPISCSGDTGSDSGDGDDN